MAKLKHKRRLCSECQEADFQAFRHRCVHESQDKNDRWFAAYEIDSYPHWDYQMEDATLIFSGGASGDLLCKMQVVGTHHGTSWEWSWGNPNLPMQCKELMDQVRTFGDEKGWDRLTTLFLEFDQFVGWECVAIASHVLDAIGVYRCGNAEDAVWVAVLSCETAA